MTEDVDRHRLVELVRSMRAETVPSLVVAGLDELQLIHGVVLQELDHRPDATVNALASRIGRSVSQTSRLVDQLVRRGLVERREDDVDRRVRRVRISSDGVAHLRRVDRIRAEGLMRLWDHITEEERPIVLRSMEIFADALKRLGAEEGERT